MREGWKYLRIKDVGEVITGNTPSTKDNDNYSSQDYCFVKPSDIEKDGVSTLSNTEFYISKKAYESSRKLPKGSVLTTCIGTIGKVGLLQIDATCNQQINAIIPSSKILPKFLALAILSIKGELELMANAPVVPIINKADFSNVIIPVPSLAEQERIVAELDLLTKIIDKQKAQLKELDNLAQSIFYDMFGNPDTNEKGWETTTYGDQFEIGAGGTPSKTNPLFWNNGSIPWIGSNMCQNSIIYETDGKFITEEGLFHSSAKLLDKGTVLVALVGATIGKVALLKTRTSTNQNIAFIKVPLNKNFTSIFVFFQLQSLYNKFLEIGNGDFKMANQSFIRSLPIPVPPLSLQQSFAAKIESIEQQKAAINKSIAETQKLFDYTMNKYFG